MSNTKPEHLARVHVKPQEPQANKLDDKANYNKMVHPELDGACYICGINPKDIEALIAEARIDELERLIGSGAAGDKYRTKAKHGFVTIEERLEQLKEQSDV